jgi:hypothetical protein
MAQVDIHAGICGFTTTVKATSEDKQHTLLEIISDCPNFDLLKKELTQADAFVECFGKIGEGQVYQAFRKCCPHGACPVPSGVIKSIEIACELALPKDVIMEISR